MNLEQVQREIRDTDAERLLLLAHDEDGVGLARMRDALGDELSASEAAKELRQHGLAQSSDRLVEQVELTGAGKRLAERIEKSRLVGSERRAAIQRGILQWLSDNPHATSTEDYVGTESATAWDVPFTAEQVDSETNWLHDNKLIKGTPTWGGPLVRPEITSLGRDVLDHDGTPSEFLYGGGGSVTDDHSSSVTVGDHANIGGIQSGGQGNTQTINHDERQQVLAQIEQVLRDFDAASDDADARASVEAIRAEAQQPTTTREKLRAMVMPAVVTAGASEAVRQGLMQLFTMLS